MVILGELKWFLLILFLIDLIGVLVSVMIRLRLCIIRFSVMEILRLWFEGGFMCWVMMCLGIFGIFSSFMVWKIKCFW